MIKRRYLSAFQWMLVISFFAGAALIYYAIVMTAYYHLPISIFLLDLAIIVPLVLLIVSEVRKKKILEIEAFNSPLTKKDKVGSLVASILSCILYVAINETVRRLLYIHLPSDRWQFFPIYYGLGDLTKLIAMVAVFPLLAFIDFRFFYGKHINKGKGILPGIAYVALFLEFFFLFANLGEVGVSFFVLPNIKNTSYDRTLAEDALAYGTYLGLIAYLAAKTPFLFLVLKEDKKEASSAK